MRLVDRDANVTQLITVETYKQVYDIFCNQDEKHETTLELDISVQSK